MGWPLVEDFAEDYAMPLCEYLSLFTQMGTIDFCSFTQRLTALRRIQS